MSLKEDFISRLIKARSALGWSQANLSKASGISATQLSRYESGLSEPRPQALGKLAKALNVQFDWLAHGRGAIEGSTPGRPAPPGIRFIPLDLTEEEHAQLTEYAQANGLTLEMAARKIVFAGLNQLETDMSVEQKVTLSELQKEIEENARFVGELVARITKVEMLNNTSPKK